MDVTEIFLWSVMAGGLLTLFLAALVEAATQRNLASFRSLAFVGLTGLACVTLSGLPQLVFPDLAPRAVLVAEASLGPLSGALALSYLGIWLGVVATDRLVRATVVLGSYALVLGSAALTLAASLVAMEDAGVVIQWAGAVNFASVMMAGVAAARGATLGDSLAWRMILACVCLAVAVAGLYAHALQLYPYGMIVWLLTASCTLGYFFIVGALTFRRNRELRDLKRRLAAPSSQDPITRLLTGAALMKKMDDVFWRSTRLHRESAVVAVSIGNLYRFHEDAGYDLDLEIMPALTARLRLAAGFVSVLGIYHSRCFVVGVSAVQDAKTLFLLGRDIVRRLRKPMVIGKLSAEPYSFVPEAGVGIVRVRGVSADTAAVLEDAERLAQSARQVHSGALIHCFGEAQAYVLDSYEFPKYSDGRTVQPAPALQSVAQRAAMRSSA